MHDAAAQFHQQARTLQASKAHFSFPLFHATKLTASQLEVNSTLEMSLQTPQLAIEGPN